MKKQNFLSPSMKIPQQYRAEGAAGNPQALLEPHKEEQTDGSVGGGG